MILWNLQCINNVKTFSMHYMPKASENKWPWWCFLNITLCCAKGLVNLTLTKPFDCVIKCAFSWVIKKLLPDPESSLMRLSQTMICCCNLQFNYWIYWNTLFIVNLIRHAFVYYCLVPYQLEFKVSMVKDKTAIHIP